MTAAAWCVAVLLVCAAAVLVIAVMEYGWRRVAAWFVLPSIVVVCVTGWHV